ncbi:hypothetical protein DFS33DRAFT_1272229 [Desarmillaria ectypa]|nr:hypothetical protein DFS33DRAFT_1272229 [Desarmillaria ectypa]
MSGRLVTKLCQSRRSTSRVLPLFSSLSFGSANVCCNVILLVDMLTRDSNGTELDSVYVDLKPEDIMPMGKGKRSTSCCQVTNNDELPTRVPRLLLPFEQSCGSPSWLRGEKLIPVEEEVDKTSGVGGECLGSYSTWWSGTVISEGFLRGASFVVDVVIGGADFEYRTMVRLRPYLFGIEFSRRPETVEGTAAFNVLLVPIHARHIGGAVHSRED